ALTPYRASCPSLLPRLLGRHRAHRRGHGPPGPRSPTHALRRARPAGDLLHDRHGTLADECDGNRMGAATVACDPRGDPAGDGPRRADRLDSAVGEGHSMRRYHWSLPLVVGVLILIATALVCVAVLGAVELALSLVMAHPPPKVQGIAQSYYRRWERYLIQFLPECAQYDPELTYILRPGVCRFRNREFDTEVRVNSRGFRSDESDLAAPVIVMAGDSYTMGWGVAQDSTFAALIGRRTGLR